ncbi:unnamed protein product [Effrenium voratum]|uniref:Uncharacterized protein n=1 Tax=Effrenium voratum TaxID=2562239 RepID=A0AA36IFL9_9DINO|nr:unnamed protein product [Effrenium voratum]CAJ1453366.1 unnamed protein product [Effrenium voratum]
MPRKRKLGGGQKVYNFHAKTGGDVVLCSLRRGKLPPKVLEALRAAVAPALDTWRSPLDASSDAPHTAAALPATPAPAPANDFGSRDQFLANGAVLRDQGADLCWLRHEAVPKGKVSAGPYHQLAPPEVRSLVDEILQKNEHMLRKVEKLMGATHDSTRGPVPAFSASSARDAVFPYICLQRRWPAEANFVPWHVDGGPSVCFLALTLEGMRTVEIETFQKRRGCRKGLGKAKTKRFTMRPGDWYWSSPSCFWHRVTSISESVSTTLLLRSAIMLRRISGGRVTATGKKTKGMKYATKDCFCKLAPAFANIIKTTQLNW